MILKISALLLSLLLLVFVSTVNAQTATDAASKLKTQTQIPKRTKADIKQQIKDRVQAKREEIKDAVAEKRNEFKIKIQTIKDQKKKLLVERIDAKLSNINVKHTDRFAHVLDNLQILLDKINESLDKMNAQTAIDAAKQAVENQAAKTYTITISTEVNLRSDIGAVTSQLRLDLTATHKTVIDAKQAVQKIRSNKTMIERNATESANL